MNKLHSVFKIGNSEVEKKSYKIGEFDIYSSDYECSYDPETILYFVDSQGNVKHTLTISASGGPEGSASLSYNFEGVK